MSSSTVRRAFAAFTTIAFVAGMALVAVTGPAAAALPKTGHYAWEYDNPGTPYPVDVAIDFDVAKVGAKLKVKKFQWQTFSCGVVTVNKAIAVKGKGKFKFLGNSKSLGGAAIKISIKGKFTSKTKAKLTVFSTDDAAYDCGDTITATVNMEK